MKGLQIHEKFEMGYFIYEDSLNEMVNYICANLANWSPKFEYWNEQLNYANKLYIVINWRKRRNLVPAAKKGETICNDQLINFLEDKSHVACFCSSV